jgi:hypothetical protein
LTPRNGQMLVVGMVCGIVIDHGVRVIAPNDCIDTADDSWQEEVIAACRNHVGHNAHTTKCLKNKLMNRFINLGGAMAREAYGDIVPEDVETYDDWRKDEAATDLYREWFARLPREPNCSLVADWLNERGGGGRTAADKTSPRTCSTHRSGWRSGTSRWSVCGPRGRRKPKSQRVRG